MPEPVLAVKSATVCYGRGPARCRALSGVTLEFEPGMLTLVMGPSGSGKTTLLSVLGCLLTPDQGSVYIAGEDVTRLDDQERTKARKRHVGFIFQAFRLFRSLTAVENVEIAAGLRDTAGKSARADAIRLLTKLELDRKLNQKPDALSGGEKQRVAIARALINAPEIILADEPTASLDSRTGDQVAQIISALAEHEGKTVVVVSHDPRWVSYANRIVTLTDGEVTDDTWSQTTLFRGSPAVCY